ncbi:MAG: hypothetical protein GX647_11975, partial [Clostridiales bacterium]|nr:hypothetical protein [Clostridiales bacterium]
MKRMIGLIMALMCLIHPALAEDGAWTDDAWATVAAALASDDPCPVPRQYRIKCSPGQTGAVSGLDGAWMNMLLL